VRREDLIDPDSTRQSSPGEEEQAEIQARLKAHLSKFLSVDLDALPQEETSTQTQGEEPQAGSEPEEPEFEFRLFSTGPVQKVVLTPVDDQKEGVYDENNGGIVENRPLSYYVRGELNPEQREQFQSAAISGGDVLQGAKQRAWGLELPWRVTKITMSSSQKSEKKEQQTDHSSTTIRIPDQEGGGKRKKLGKKARIATRIKQKAAAELEKQRMTKEEHLKEKKKRLNREKKLKRRQKEKEKKLAAGIGGGDGNDDASGADSMSEGED